MSLLYSDGRRFQQGGGRQRRRRVERNYYRRQLSPYERALIKMSTINMEVNTYTENTRVYYTNYIRNYRAVGVMWAVFVICFAIVNIVVFLQPQWIGDTDDSPGIGYFGLFEYCQLFTAGQNLYCEGQFDRFDSILSDEFKAASFFIGFSALVVLICICCMLMFFFMRASYVFVVCGIFLALSGEPHSSIRLFIYI